MISIIVPVYNTEKYLERCIQSILAQTYIDFELLLIDDGSTDSSGVICDQYAEQDSRVRVFHKENGGVSSARNIGLDNASGEWIAFVDSDDWVQPKYIEDLFTKDNADFVANYFVEGGKHITNNEKSPFEDKYYKGDEVRDYIGKYLYEMLNPVCKRFKKSIIKRNNLRFKENISFGEDTIFVFSYLNKVKSIATTSSRYYYYNYTPNSLSQVHYKWDEYRSFIDEIINAVNRVGNVYDYNVNPILSRILGNCINKFISDSAKDYSILELRKNLIEMSKEDVVRMQLKDRSYAKSRRRKLIDFLLLYKFYFILALCLKAAYGVRN